MNNFLSLQNIQVIESKKNTQVQKLIKIVSSNKYRQSEKLFWIEGIKICESYFKNIQIKKNIIFVFNHKTNKKQIFKFVEENNIGDIKFICLNTSLFKEISQIENSPGWGIVASYPDDVRKETKKFNDLIILDRIQDPGNLGNIIRTSAAAGVKNIWLTKGTSDPYSPKVIRAASGGQFLTNFSFFSDLDEILKKEEIAEMLIIATDLKGKSINLYNKKLDLKKKCAWIFGSEGLGISQSIISSNNLLSLKIPHSKEIDSLNVASAAAICLFEMNRQRSN